MGRLQKLTFSVFVLCFFSLGQTGCEPEPNYDAYEKSLHAFQNAEIPIVVINTNGNEIPDEPKADAQFMLFAEGTADLAELNGLSPDLESTIGIEIRGWSSQRFPKKQYTIELRNNDGTDRDVSVFGFPEEADWILQAPFTDKSLIRNQLAYRLAEQMGHYAPRIKFVELFLVEDGTVSVGLDDYRGVYAFTEKIKRDKGRVNIEKMNASDAELPDVTGGYLLELTQTKRIKAEERLVATGLNGSFVIKYPKAEKLTDTQQNWISAYVADFEKTLENIDPENSNGEYGNYIDVDSFVDYFLINEFLRNYDIFTASTYAWKPRDGKLRMGPVWDFDRAMGDVEFDGQWSAAGWLMPERGWAKKLLKDEQFLQAYRARWKALRQNEFKLDGIYQIIDDATASLGSAINRNFSKWDVLGNYVEANRKPYSQTHEEEIEKIKQWLEERALWMDANIDTLSV